MLNPELNIPLLRQAFSANGMVSIQNILTQEVAEALYAAVTQLRWDLEIKDHSKKKPILLPVVDGMSPVQILDTLGHADFPLNKDDLFFARYCADEAQFNSESLREFSTFLHSQKFLDTMIDITGNRELTHVWFGATCFGKCCFLGAHQDSPPIHNAIAFVLNFTPRWQMDWGGLLIIKRPSGETIILPPMWNSLNMFNVPVPHLVSSVSPAATENRYSITGWLRRGPEPGSPSGDHD